MNDLQTFTLARSIFVNQAQTFVVELQSFAVECLSFTLEPFIFNDGALSITLQRLSLMREEKKSIVLVSSLNDRVSS